MFKRLLRKCIWVFMFVLTAMQTMEAVDTDGDLANGVNFEASLTKTEFNFDGNVVDISQYISANARFEIIDLDPAVCPGNYQIQVKLSPDEENYIGEVVTLYYDIIGKVPAPVVETQTCTSITLEAFDNCIYGISFEGGFAWKTQPSQTFRNLETGKTYTIAQAINGCQSENVEITLDHDYDEGVVSKEPTCTEKGEKTYTCKHNLSHKKVEEIPTKDHELEVVETEPATCTEDGHKAIVKCKVCGELIIAGEVIPALGHDLVHVEAKSATCTEDGNVEYYYCKREPGKFYTDEALTQEISEEELKAEATGHKWVVEGNYHRCSIAGCKTMEKHTIDPLTGECTVCEYEHVHVWETDYEHHLCKNDDYKCGYQSGVFTHDPDADGKCTVCGYKHEHDWRTDNNYHSCNVKGCDRNYEDYHTLGTDGICTVCGYVHVHDWYQDKDVHFCFTDDCGKHYPEEKHTFENGKCTVCGMTDLEGCTISLDQEMFEWTGEVQKPSITVRNSKGELLVKGEDYALDPEWENCNSYDRGTYTSFIRSYPDGYNVYKFTWRIYSTDCYNGAPHEWVEDAEHTGYHVCSTCHSPGAHEAEEVAYKPATCTEPGHKDGIRCKVCGAIISGCEKIDPLGHNFLNDTYVSDGNATCTANGTATAKCTRCDETDTREEANSALGHDFTKQIVSEDTRWADATCESSAVYYYSCSRCHEADTDETNTFKFCEPLGHDLKLVENAVEPTCTEKGKSAKYECAREGCEHTEGGEEIKALGHEFLSYKFNNDATCIADGTETAKCTRCDVTDTRNADGTAHGHVTIKFDAVPATCTNPGNKEYYICAYEPDEKYKDAAGIETYTDEDPYIIPTVPHLFTIHSDADEKGLHNLLCEYGCNTAKANTKVIENALGEGNDIELNEEGGKLVYKGDLALGDRGEFFSPVDFTVLGNVSFDRIASKDTMTLILPYDVPAEDVAGQVYTLSYFDGKALRYEEADGIKANVPCMIRLSDGQSSLNSTLVKGQSDVTLRSTTTIDTVVANGGKAIQFGAYKETVYQSGDNSQEYDYYGYKNGKFVKARLDISVSPFRSAVRLTKASGLRSLNFDYNLDELPIIFGGEATNVEEVDATAEFGGKVNVYDALGRAIRLDVDAEGALDGLNDGLYMVNGKRVYVKNQR